MFFILRYIAIFAVISHKEIAIHIKIDIGFIRSGSQWNCWCIFIALPINFTLKVGRLCYTNTGKNKSNSIMTNLNSSIKGVCIIFIVKTSIGAVVLQWIKFRIKLLTQFTFLILLLCILREDENVWIKAKVACEWSQPFNCRMQI